MLSIAQPASPHIAAEASAVCAPAFNSASFAAPACTARRFLDSGAQTTRHVIEQSTGTVHELWIVNSTLSSPLSCWPNEVQSAIDFVPRSAKATAAGTQQIEMARAYAAHRVQVAERMMQTSGDG